MLVGTIYKLYIIVIVIGGSENNATVLASLSTALHLDKKPVVGQVILFVLSSCEATL